jgi:hypothetical protein
MSPYVVVSEGFSVFFVERFSCPVCGMRNVNRIFQGLKSDAKSDAIFDAENNAIASLSKTKSCFA